jgi:hypothetical protein
MSLETRRECKQNHYSRDGFDKDNRIVIRLVTSMEESRADWMSAWMWDKLRPGRCQVSVRTLRSARALSVYGVSGHGAGTDG